MTSANTGTWENYKFGSQCKVYHPLGLTFVLIPKNCSTSFAWINGHDWSYNRSPLPDIGTDRMCCILRNPYERFISALNMYLSEPEFFVKFNRQLEQGLFNSKDPHFFPQAYHIKSLDRSKIDFWYQRPGVVGDMFRYYGVPHDDVHANAAGPREEKIVAKVNPHLIREKYHMDYQLIQEVNFINV